MDFELRQCAQICAYHQTIRSSLNSDGAAGNAFAARILLHYVDAH
jgi:hypothetical protein